MSMFPITSLYAALLMILLVVLSGMVIRSRVVHRVELGDGGNPDLLRMIRVQANFSEHVPLALVGIALVESGGHNPWLVHALGAGLVIGRVLHAVGLARTSGPSTGRFIGMNLTYLALLVSAGALIYSLALK